MAQVNKKATENVDNLIKRMKPTYELVAIGLATKVIDPSISSSIFLQWLAKLSLKDQSYLQAAMSSRASLDERVFSPSRPRKEVSAAIRSFRKVAKEIFDNKALKDPETAKHVLFALIDAMTLKARNTPDTIIDLHEFHKKVDLDLTEDWRKYTRVLLRNGNRQIVSDALERAFLRVDVRTHFYQFVINHRARLRRRHKTLT